MSAPGKRIRTRPRLLSQESPILEQSPSATSAQFIDRASITAARARMPGLELSRDPVVFGVDCARFDDDHSALAIRCGRDARSRPWQRWQRREPMMLAHDIALAAARWKPDAIFVDAGNLGAAVVDRLRQLGVENVFEVWFDSKRVREAQGVGGAHIRVASKRAEMWIAMRQWLEGGCIPDHQGLEDDLAGPRYSVDADQAVRLEERKDMKGRGLASPDDADALACTFAEPALSRAMPGWLDPSRYRAGRG